jgi:hypothetical protein
MKRRQSKEEKPEQPAALIPYQPDPLGPSRHRSNISLSCFNPFPQSAGGSGKNRHLSNNSIRFSSQPPGSIEPEPFGLQPNTSTINTILLE